MAATRCIANMVHKVCMLIHVLLQTPCLFVNKPAARHLALKQEHVAVQQHVTIEQIQTGQLAVAVRDFTFISRHGMCPHVRFEFRANSRFIIASTNCTLEDRFIL